MFTLLSPAKTLNWNCSAEGLPTTEPRLGEDTQLLLTRCRKLRVSSLRKLMNLSQPLAELNRERFQEMTWPSTVENDAKPALLAFGGDVYRGLDAASLNKRDLKWAQGRLRILSGFFGILRPLDLIQPYRLEMGTRLSNPRGKNLYQFWGRRIVDTLNAEHAERPVKAVVNLASNEYFKAVRTEHLAVPLVTALFQEFRDGKLRTISFSAKRARGLMARHIVKNRVHSPAGMKSFADEGYSYYEHLSNENTMVFARDQHWAG